MPSLAEWRDLISRRGLLLCDDEARMSLELSVSSSSSGPSPTQRRLINGRTSPLQEGSTSVHVLSAKFEDDVCVEELDCYHSNQAVAAQRVVPQGRTEMASVSSSDRSASPRLIARPSQVFFEDISIDDEAIPDDLDNVGDIDIEQQLEVEEEEEQAHSIAMRHDFSFFDIAVFQDFDFDQADLAQIPAVQTGNVDHTASTRPPHVPSDSFASPPTTFQLAPLLLTVGKTDAREKYLPDDIHGAIDPDGTETPASRHPAEAAPRKRHRAHNSDDEDETEPVPDIDENATQQSEATVEIVQPLVLVLQSLSVYLSTMNMPTAYLNVIRSPVALLSISWTVTTSPTVFLLIQLFVGLVCISALLYLVQLDEQYFAWYLGRYALRRDTLSATPPGNDDKGTGDHFLSSLGVISFGEDDLCIDQGEIALLNLAMAKQVDQFVRSAEFSLVEVFFNGDRYVVQRAASSLSMLPQELSGDADAAPTLTIEKLKFCCPYHPSHLLAAQMQTSVWPFYQRPTCCAAPNGQRCNKSSGKMYKCGLREEIHGGEKKETTRCMFALCHEHARASPLDLMIADLISPLRQQQDATGSGITAAVALFLVNLVYMPFVKSALMILSCHPAYQCMLGTCWKKIDQQFILTAYLAMVMVLCLGLGAPVVLTLLLYRRRHMLCSIFFSPEYTGKFGSDDSASSAKAEWQRFITSDFSALGTLYKDFRFKWIFAAPILLLWKVLLVVPPVFVESNTFPQIVAIGVSQMLFALFFFVASPSTSDVVNGVYKLGSVHQIVIVGLLSLDTYNRFHGTKGPVDAIMIALTLSYVIFCVLLIAFVKLRLWAEQTLLRSRMSCQLAKYGIQYSVVTTQYVVHSGKLAPDNVQTWPGEMTACTCKLK